MHALIRVFLLPLMDEGSLGHETLPAELAGEGISPGVLGHVDLQVVGLLEHLPAHLAVQRPPLPHSCAVRQVLLEVVVVLADVGEAVAALWAPGLLLLEVEASLVRLQTVLAAQNLNKNI